MKKIAIIIIIITIAFTTSGCLGAYYGRNPFAFSNDAICKDRAEEIVKYIKRKDSSSIVKLFSNNIRKSDGKLNQQAYDFLNCFENNINEKYVPGIVYAEKDKDSDKDLNEYWVVAFEFKFLIFEGTDAYELEGRDVILDDYNENNKGLEYIHVRKIKKYKNNDNYEVYYKGEIKGNGIIIK